jgi:hypothetical protein
MLTEEQAKAAADALMAPTEVAASTARPEAPKPWVIKRAISRVLGHWTGVIALAASLPLFPRRVRSALGSLGLVSSSAILTHFSGGYIEAHFHFFVMIGVLTLYQDWLPFLVAIGYVVLHHGLAGLRVGYAIGSVGSWLWRTFRGPTLPDRSC